MVKYTSLGGTFSLLFVFFFSGTKIWRCSVFCFENYRLFRSKCGTIKFMRYFFEIRDKHCSSRAKNDAVKFLFATIFFEFKYTSLGGMFSLPSFFQREQNLEMLLSEFWKLQVIWDNLIYEIFYSNLRQTLFK